MLQSAAGSSEEGADDIGATLGGLSVPQILDEVDEALAKQEVRVAGD